MPLRVLIISDTPSHSMGGVATETFSLAHGLASRGHSVSLLMDHPHPGLGAINHLPLTIPPGRHFESELRFAIGSFNPNIVHVMSLRVTRLHEIGVICGRTPWLLTVHSIPPHERVLSMCYQSARLHYAVRNLKYVANHVMWRLLLRNQTVPHIICHSRDMSSLICGLGFPRAKVSTLPIGVQGTRSSTPRPRSFGDSPRLVTVAGTIFSKGLHDGILAVRLLLPRYPNIRYDLIGEVRDAGYHRFLQSLIRRLRLERSVFMHVSVDLQTKHDLLAAADLYLQPSHEEGFCIAFAEAAFIVPRLVGTRRGVIPAIVESDPNAALVGVSQPVELAGAASDLLQRTVNADQMRTRDVRLRQLLDEQNFVDSHAQLYCRLIASA